MKKVLVSKNLFNSYSNAVRPIFYSVPYTVPYTSPRRPLHVPYVPYKTPAFLANPLNPCHVCHELLFWPDFRYNPGHPRRNEQGLRIDEGTWKRLLEGLPTLIGVPKTDASRSDFVYSEDVAMIFTGPFKLIAYRNGRVDDTETEQLSCRMRRMFFDKAALQRVGPAPKLCPTCWSRWVLRGEMQWRRQGGHAIDEFMANAAATIGELQVGTMSGSSTGARLTPSISIMADLARAVEWRQQGLLSEEEFQATKRALGLS